MINPKAEHLKLYQQLKCVYQIEDDAINGLISVEQAFDNFENCNGFLPEPQITGTSGNARFMNLSEGEEVVFSKEYEIAVYPNPTQGNLAIAYNLKNYSDIRFDIFDMQGKQILSQKLDAKQNIFNILDLNLENGVYLYSIKGDGANLMTKKLVLVN